jgi:hypothetical protein
MLHDGYPRGAYRWSPLVCYAVQMAGTTQVAIRVPNELLDRIKKVAAAERRSLAQTVNLILSDGLPAWEAHAGIAVAVESAAPVIRRPARTAK